MDYFDEFDWSKTPLGARSTWSSALKTTYNIMMSSGFGMCAMWGPEKTFLYNRAYAPFLGKRHPQALGQPMPEVWHDVWADILPIIEKAMSGESVYMEGLHLVMTRNGFEEDTYWTFSYSPLYDDQDQVVGFLDVATDITETINLRRAMEERAETLAESEARLLKLVTAGAYSLYRMSPDWVEMRQLDGQGILEDTTTPSVRWLDFYIDDADRPDISAAIDAAVAGRTTFELEHRVKLPDGGMGWVFSRAVPIFDAKGDIIEWFGAASDITARKQAEQQQELVNYEIGHRLKNVLAVVQSIAAQTLRSAPDVKAAQQSLSERMSALARAQDVLLSGEARTSDLSAIIESAMKYSDDRYRIQLDGPSINVGPSMALNLTLTINELATNALKYGSLSVASGMVSVDWRADDKNLYIRWKETGGPLVLAPTSKGFGSRLIERSIVGGSATVEYDPAGLRCTLEVPLDRLTIGQS